MVLNKHPPNWLTCANQPSRANSHVLVSFPIQSGQKSVPLSGATSVDPKTGTDINSGLVRHLNMHLNITTAIRF